MDTRKTHAVVIITVMGFSFAAVRFLAFNLSGYRGEHPADAVFAIELLASLFAQFLSGNKPGHTIIPFANSVRFDERFLHIVPNRSRSRSL